MQDTGLQYTPEVLRLRTSMEVIDSKDKSHVQPQAFRPQIVWLNAFVFLIAHLGCVYGLFEGLRRGSYCGIAWCFFVLLCSGIGVTMGAHRLYSHKAFKAKTWLRIVLVFLQTMAGQNCMYVWVRDHRLHHKHSETDADPHDSRRGFFFSHVGWLMTRKHPEVIAKGKLIDMSDLEAEPIIRFQRK